jgi:hypothetical protein
VTVTLAPVLRHPPTARPQCGSDHGYRIHLDAYERACDACLRAHRRDWADWNRRSQAGLIRRPAPRPCGTLAARKRHIRRGEPVCERCRLANRLGRDLTPSEGAP